MNPHETLLARPSIEDMAARYSQMQNRIRTEIDRVLGPQQWQQFDPPSSGNCGFDFPNEAGSRTISNGTYGFTAAVPDEKWSQAKNIVAGIAREYGFTEAAEVQIDKPGRHEFGVNDPDLGAYLEFGSDKFTVLGVSSGCHLLKSQISPK